MNDPTSFDHRKGTGCKRMSSVYFRMIVLLAIAVRNARSLFIEKLLERNPTRRSTFRWGNHVELHDTEELHDRGECVSEVPEHAFHRTCNLLSRNTD